MFEDLDPRLTNALDALRKEFDDKLTRQLQEFASEAESTEVAQAEEGPATTVAAPADLLEELKLAAAEIDRSESQADVLDALIRATSRFSSRAAVFLRRDTALKGWGGTGFGAKDGAIKDLELNVPSGSPWAEVGTGSGGLGLNGDDCGVLTERLGVDNAQVGLLVPFILQSQVAAVVYCDRTDSSETFSVAGLQLLSFLSGLTVETLPVRGRTSTGSLHLASATVIADEAAVAAEPEAFAEPAVEPAVEPTVEPAVEPTVEYAVEPAPESTEEPAEEPAVAEMEPVTPWSEPESLETPADLDTELPSALDEPVDSVEPSIGLTAPEPTAPVEPVPTPYEAIPEDLADSGPEPAPEMPVAAAPSYEEPTETPPLEAPSIGGQLDEPVVESPEPAEMPLAPDPVEPGTEPGVSVPATEAAPPEAGGLGSTQVRPPQDVEGPGWAFTTTKIPTSAGTDAVHEEARRLARLLVTEIKLYNEEMVEEGRKSGNVYSRLREDIDRSRQIFDDRIDPEVRSEKDYFHEALVRILAGGDPAVLGD